MSTAPVNAARRQGQEPGERPQERRLACAVRPDQCGDFAAMNGEVDAAEDSTPAVRKRNAFCLQYTSHDCLHNSQRKNGPPSMVVTTPTGSSAGRTSVRAPRSAKTKSAAPPKADAGKSMRWAGVPIRRIRCGATKPTNPMTPTKATAA